VQKLAGRAKPPAANKLTLYSREKGLWMQFYICIWSQVKRVSERSVLYVILDFIPDAKQAVMVGWGRDC